MMRSWKSGAGAAAVFSVVVLGSAFAQVSAARSEEYQLPPEVTPQMRAACEADVRRLCIGNEPTVDKVKRCVVAKFLMLGRKCQVELASLGIGK